ncbi:MAG TPA: alkaline phosphatase family protein [Solirubrobacteraceae bacterium]|nr:alkaline phosphatase family protein [Solirubrobacteraceae bacterium]
MARRPTLAFLAVLAAAGTSAVAVQAASAGSDNHTHAARSHVWPSADRGRTSQAATPIKHLVVIFQENVSFDHYFGTYPNATNPAGEPAFHAASDTPSVNGLSGALLTNNPNLSNPQRLDRSQAATCDQDHGYSDEQSAFDHGLMDQFVQKTGASLTLAQCLANEGNTASAGGTNPNYAVMDYYDGNTVTGLWNYAQHFALSDNSFGTNFGPSTPGAINVTAGNTYGAICGPTSAVYNGTPCAAAPGSASATPGTPSAPGTETVYSDADPNYDVCSNTQDGNKAATTIQMGGQNIGDLLDKSGTTWGWFQGGFASPGYVPGQPSTDNLSKVCTGTHTNILGNTVKDYSPHHEPFQYYASTANPQHLPPTSISMIGHQDQANHQYDISDFFAAADHGNLPAVSYLKAPEYQDGHAGYSDPLDEQRFLAQTINNLEHLPTWKSTAVVIAYDDSDGWYDHQLGPITSQSQTALDTLTGTGACGSSLTKVPTTDSGTPEQARCGVGPRLPLLVVSPYAKSNYVDNTFTDQTSVVKFIEDNWLGGQRIGNGSADATAGTLQNMFDWGKPTDRRLFLDPSTGEPTSGGH